MKKRIKTISLVVSLLVALAVIATAATVSYAEDKEKINRKDIEATVSLETSQWSTTESVLDKIKVKVGKSKLDVKKDADVYEILDAYNNLSIEYKIRYGEWGEGTWQKATQDYIAQGYSYPAARGMATGISTTDILPVVSAERLYEDGTLKWSDVIEVSKSGSPEDTLYAILNPPIPESNIQSEQQGITQEEIDAIDALVVQQQIIWKQAISYYNSGIFNWSELQYVIMSELGSEAEAFNIALQMAQERELE